MKTAKNKSQKGSSKTAALDAKTSAEVKASITEKKELKYVYPENCEKGADKETLLKRRKHFRAEVRRKLHAFEKSIKKLGKSKEEGAADDLRKVTKKYDAYKAEVLVK